MRRSWRPNRTATYWPHSIDHNRVSFPLSWAAQPRAWSPASLGAGFLNRISSPTRLISKTHSGVPRAPSAGCCFLYSIIFQLSDLQTNWFPVFTELYNSSTPTQYLSITGHRNMHFCRLWNGMFDRHRAEITVMSGNRAEITVILQNENYTASNSSLHQKERVKAGVKSARCILDDRNAWQIQREAQ